MLPNRSQCEQLEEGFSQSFALQFISLVLFILIFVVTSNFSNSNSDIHSKEDVHEVSNVLNIKNSVHDKVIFEQQLTPEYFSANYKSLQLSEWQTLFEMIKDHDLSVVVTLAADSLSEKLSKAESIYSLLLEAGVPTEALRVETSVKTENDFIKLIEGDVSW
jgi:hypothetical protein